MVNFCKELKQSEWEPISSKYLSEGRKSEKWLINSVELGQGSLLADISMANIFEDSTSNQKFHLPAYAALEFVSQLQIIYMHLWAGYQEKTREVWMIESRFKAHFPIYDSQSIKVKMEIEKIKSRDNNIYCTATHRVFDSGKGSFTIWIKAWMPD